MSELYHLPKGGTQAGAGVWLGRLALWLIAVVLSLGMATQYIAWKFHFHPNLGTPLLKTPIGNLYEPFHIFVWWWNYRHIQETEPWFEWAWLLASSFHAVELAVIALAIRRDRQFGGKADTLGSARWASPDEVKSSGLWQQQDGVYIGGWYSGKTLHYLRHNGPQNVLGFAPGRSGKGVGLVVPTLLSWLHSAVVYDVKRENWPLTAGWRKQTLGSLCIEFNPTCNDGSAARCNPLLWTRPHPYDVRDAQILAEVLTNPSGDPGDARYAEESHWKLAAQDLIVGVLLHQLYAGKEKTLAGCLSVLDGDGQKVEKTLRTMMETAHDPSGKNGWPNNSHPAIAGSMRAILNKSENERSGVISTAAKFFSLYRDTIVARNTATCDFAIEDLMREDQPVSLYLTTPPSDLDRTRPLMRLVLMLITKRLSEKMKQLRERDMTRRLLLMLDEFPQLGRLEFLHAALSYMPGYGIKTYIIVQDIGQIHQLYGQHESITTSCPIKVAYTPNTIETARTMSEMLGNMTVIKETRTYTGRRLSFWLPNIIASEMETQRPLLTPEELLRMPETDAIIFPSERHSIYGHKIRYYEDATFAQRANMPAPTQSDRLPFAHPWTYIAPQQEEELLEETPLQEIGAPSELQQEMEKLL